MSDFDYRDLLQSISGSLSSLLEHAKKRTDAINEYCQTYKEQRGIETLVDAKLRTPVPISVHAETQERQGGWQRVKIGFEIIGIIAAVAYVGWAYRQWKEMSYQTDMININTRKARRDTANADRRMLEQLTIAKGAADAAESQTKVVKKSIDATVEQFRLDQRAWVNLQSIVPHNIEATDLQQPPTHPGMSVSFVFKNTGKTPAINVGFDASLIFRPPDQPIPIYTGDPRENYRKLTGIKESGVIGPSEEHNFEFPSTGTQPIFLGPNQIRMMQQRITVLYIVGKLAYSDVFPHTPDRVTQFCTMYEPSAGRMGMCPTGRTMN
ncbi:MAG: hypothetical protein WB799_00390 [Candidatus Sulfotelmatobacter sp.]